MIADDEFEDYRKKSSWFILIHVVICLRSLREIMKNHDKATAKPRFEPDNAEIERSLRPTRR